MTTIKNIIAGIFSLLFFLILLGMTSLLFISNAFEKEYYKEVLQDINFEEIKLNEIGIKNYDEELGNNASVNDVLVKEITKFNINPNDANKIINNNKVKEIIGNVMADVTTYLVNKEKIPQIKFEDVKKVIQTEEVKQVLENIPSDEKLEELVNKANQMIKNYLSKENNNE